MSAGFEWNELGDVSEYNDWVLARDQLDYLLARPLIAPPGTTFSYNSAAVHLLSAVLQEHAGGTAAFADARLLGPLGITQRDWEVDDRGIPNGGAGLYLRPLDMAKLGQLVLQRGRSGSKEVIPTAWIDESIRAHIVPHSSVPGLGDLGYGYLWWLGRSGGHDAAFAWGYGGQFIYIVPDLDLVVVTTATWQGLGTGQAAQAESILAFIATRIAPTAL
jgi:CubicO group peptidase (beta-lactamase class C family)